MKAELLAPAGNLACALTAFDHGADAVYCGLQRFNARERTANFSLEDFSRLLAFSRDQNKKVYLTLNTLLKEEEIPELLQLLAKVYPLQPDALIIQDPGLIYLVHQFFPQLALHASTQMGIHNSLGVKQAADMGIERVILERQVSLDELKVISRKSPVELEVFVHGALCCSLSGTCLFSSWIGGWSGNRGKCKQPCRRRYFHQQGNGFFFSTQDLYGLDLMGELMDLGIASFKIEGRLKQPDYVKSTVQAYKMMMDALPEERAEVLPEARSVLAKSYGRKWSSGFYFSEEKAGPLIEEKKLGVSGQLCGEVKKTARKGFTLLALRRIHIGDRLRVQHKSGEEGPAFTLTRMSQDNKSIKTISKGQQAFIHFDKEIDSGSLVYRIGESSTDHSSRIAKLPLAAPLLKLDMKIKLNEEGLCIRVTSPAGDFFWEEKFKPQLARAHSISKEEIVDFFHFSSEDHLSCKSYEINIKDNYFIPRSQLKALRRAFRKEVISFYTVEKIEELYKPSLYLALENYAKWPGGEGPQTITKYLLKTEAEKTHHKTLVLELFHDKAEKADQLILPFFCPEHQIAKMQERVNQLYKVGMRHFRLSSLFQLEFFRDKKDCKLSASFPLPASNSAACRQLQELGFDLVQLWPELGRLSLEATRKKYPASLEQYVRGYLPLLATRANLPQQGSITDNRGQGFYISKNDFGSGLTILYGEKLFSVPLLSGFSAFEDERSIDSANGSYSFNFEHGLV